MGDLIIACSNLKNEIEMIRKEITNEINIIYLDSKYHNNPKELHKKLDEIIGKEEKNYNKITLLYGQCGNSIIDLKSDCTILVFPKVSDCISLYLGGNKKRSQLYKSEKSYFFTKTYIENENSLYNELVSLKKKHGEKKALRMYKMVMNNYEYIRVINTKAYDMKDIMMKVEELCKDLDLNHEIIDGDLSLVKKSLMGQVDEDFVVKEKGQKVSNQDFI